MDASKSSSESESESVHTYSEKLCVILSLSGDYGVFIVDCNDVNAEDEFVEKRPNLLLRDFLSPCFCASDDGNLYVFPGSEPNSSNTQACSFELSEISKLSDAVLERKSMSMRHHDMVGPKLSPKAIRHGHRILVFSSGVPYYFDDIDHDWYCDFEIYDPLVSKSTKLPQLRIRSSSSSFDRSFEFFHSSTGQWEEFPYRGEYEMYTRYTLFYITAFTVIGCMFIIQTEFGQLFSLNLDLPSDKCHWSLFDQAGRGRSLFRYCGMENPILIPNCDCQLMLGVVPHSSRGVSVNFPLLLFKGEEGYDEASSIALLKPRFHSQDHLHPIHTVCTLQAMSMEPSDDHVYWLLSLYTLDCIKFPFEEKNREEPPPYWQDVSSYRKCVRRLNFFMKEADLCGKVIGLFPFEY